MKNTIFVSFLLLGCWLSPLRAQISLRVGTDVPIQYAVGADWQFHRHFSVGAKAGVLTAPYSNAILGLLAAFGTDQIYVDLIDEAFQLGTIGELSANGHFGKNYAGLYGQTVMLRAGDAPKALMEAALGVTIPNPGIGPNAPALELALTSRLYQIGARYGRRFPISEQFELRAEIGVSKNIGSVSKIYTNSRSTDNLNALIDSEFKPIYSSYAYLPALSIYAIWNLTKAK